MADNVHKGHRERVRKKFIKTGFTGFADHEKLELLLFYSRPRIDTNAIAHNLIDKFKTIGGVFDADFDMLKEVDGVDEATAVLLKMIPALSKEYVNSKISLTSMGNYKTACEYFKNQFLGENVEKVRIACVDDKLRLVDCAVISDEDIKATSDLFRTLKPVGIMLLDHIIVAGGQAISLKESGAFTLLK